MSRTGRRIASSLAIALFTATVVPCPETAATIVRPTAEASAAHHGAGQAADDAAAHSGHHASHSEPAKRPESHASHAGHSGHSGREAHGGHAGPVASTAESAPPAPTVFLDAPCPCGCAERATPSSAVGRLAAAVPSSPPAVDDEPVLGAVETLVLALADAPLSAIDHIPDFA